MSGIWSVLLLALLPGAGNFVGGMIAEFGGASPLMLNWSLHAASGIVIAIVAVELMPKALASLAGWWIAAAFAAGGAAYVIIEWLLDRLEEQPRGGTGDDRTGMWMIYVAVAVDLTSDGLMIGTGSAVSPALALVLAAGQVLADIPEGYATVANFRDKKVARGRRILLSVSFLAFALGAALASYLLLRGAPQGIKVGALVFVAGLLTVAAAEDMLEEAHAARQDNRLSVFAFIAGFALFILVSAGLETVVGGADISGRGNSNAAEDTNAPRQDR